METFEAIESRRAVKHYDPTHKITPEEEKKLLGAALLSPTAFNIQQWRFVVVRDPEIRKQIRTVAWDQAQVTEASMLVILCGDVNSWDKDPVRYWKDAPEPVREFMTPAIKAYYDNKPQVQRDEVMRSCGIAGQTLMLAARDMGYDSLIASFNLGRTQIQDVLSPCTSLAQAMSTKAECDQSIAANLATLAYASGQL